MKISPKISLRLSFCILFIFLFMLPPIVLSRPFNQQPFKSFQLLEGCRKGQKVAGLHELKWYLKRFGYLSYPDKSNNSLTHADDDEFDDLLEAAVKTYQLNYNLKVTGSLDSATVKLLMLPRCGVPDIINGTNSMMRSNNSHIRSYYTFFPNTPKWPANRRNLTYRFRSSAPVFISVEDVQFAISMAFQSWERVTNFKFTPVAEDAKADIEVGFHRGDHGDGNSFDGPHHVTAHAYAPSDGRTHFDADETWSIIQNNDAADLESVALHEIGHILGLMHSPHEEAVMYPTLPYGSIGRVLSNDDMDGIQTLYR